MSRQEIGSLLLLLPAGYDALRWHLGVRLHSHAIDRLGERGATEEEVVRTVLEGERFPAKFGRTGFRRNFGFDDVWRGKHYATKQIEAIAVEEEGDWLVLTIVTKYF